MQLPKYKKKKRIKLKICREPGCGREFLGHPIAKYCAAHKDIKNRIKIKREYDAVDLKNMIFKHEFSEVVEVQFKCKVPGCSNLYTI
ncbi:MAG: hypothetical protein ABIA63_06740, partial [bacterium]